MCRILFLSLFVAVFFSAPCAQAGPQNAKWVKFDFSVEQVEVNTDSLARFGNTLVFDAFRVGKDQKYPTKDSLDRSLISCDGRLFSGVAMDFDEARVRDRVINFPRRTMGEVAIRELAFDLPSKSLNQISEWCKVAKVPSAEIEIVMRFLAKDEILYMSLASLKIVGVMREAWFSTRLSQMNNPLPLQQEGQTNEEKTRAAWTYASNEALGDLVSKRMKYRINCESREMTYTRSVTYKPNGEISASIEFTKNEIEKNMKDPVPTSVEDKIRKTVCAL